jgi:hypothetical protein
MSQKTDIQLTSDSNVIRQETRRAFNTKVRVANMFQDIIDSKVNNTTFTATTATLLSITAFDFYAQQIAPNLYASLTKFNAFTASTLSSVTLQKEVTGTTYIVQSDDRNYAIYFTNAAETLVVLKNLTTNFEFTAIRKEGAGVVRFSGTTSGSSVSLKTIDNLLTIGREKGAVTWIQKNTTQWYGFGALGSGATSSGGSGVSQAKIDAYTGGTSGSSAPATYVRKNLFNTYTGATNTALNNRVLNSIFTGYTASTISVSEITINGATALTSSAYGVFYLCTGTSADYIVSLPSAVGHTGKSIGFKGQSSLTKVVTLSGSSGQTIDGEASRALGVYGILVLISNGTNWVIANEVGSWIPWTPTFAGFSSNPTADARYFRVGKKIDIRITMTAGTSNSGTFTFTLPFNALNSLHFSVIGINAGVGTFCRGNTGAGTNVFTLFATAAGLGFTASGNKSYNGSFSYEMS